MKELMNQVYFKNTPVNLERNLPNVGSRIVNISFTKEDLEDADLSSFDNTPLILWFVPSLDTGVCLTSTKKLDEHLKKHPKAKALILSMDLPFAQKRICGLENLNHVKTASLFRHPETLSKLGLLITEGPLKGLSARCVFVLDSHHNILSIDLVQEITHEPDYHEIFKKI
jgi:thioredoxin-dependent peroxiredoxin